MNVISIPLGSGDQYRFTKRRDGEYDISRVNDEYDRYYGRKATEAEVDMAIMIDALRDLVSRGSLS